MATHWVAALEQPAACVAVLTGPHRATTVDGCSSLDFAPVVEKPGESKLHDAFCWLFG